MLQSQTLKQMRSLGLRGIALTARCRSEAESPALFTAKANPLTFLRHARLLQD